MTPEEAAAKIERIYLDSPLRTEHDKKIFLGVAALLREIGPLREELEKTKAERDAWRERFLHAIEIYEPKTRP